MFEQGEDPMSNGVVLREPPSIVDSESGYIATTGIEPDCVVLGNLGNTFEL